MAIIEAPALEADLCDYAAPERGILLSWVRFHRACWEGFQADLPYLVGLDEGPMPISGVVGMAAEAPRVGARVEVIFETVDEELTLPKFRVCN